MASLFDGMPNEHVIVELDVNTWDAAAAPWNHEPAGI
jgi:hypothetical protein